MNWQEYKQRKEAQRYFRQNNDQFLDAREWLFVIGKALISAIVFGFLLALLTHFTHIRFSILYIVIGLAIANVVTTTSRIESPQMGIVSAIMAFVSFAMCQMFMLLLVVGFNPLFIIPSIIGGFTSLLSGDLFNLIFMIMGMFCAYRQASH